MPPKKTKRVNRGLKKPKVSLPIATAAAIRNVGSPATLDQIVEFIKEWLPYYKNQQTWYGTKFETNVFTYRNIDMKTVGSIQKFFIINEKQYEEEVFKFTRRNAIMDFGLSNPNAWKKFFQYSPNFNKREPSMAGSSESTAVRAGPSALDSPVFSPSGAQKNSSQSQTKSQPTDDNVSTRPTPSSSRGRPRVCRPSENKNSKQKLGKTRKNVDLTLENVSVASETNATSRELEDTSDDIEEFCLIDEDDLNEPQPSYSNHSPQQQNFLPVQSQSTLPYKPQLFLPPKESHYLTPQPKNTLPAFKNYSQHATSVTVRATNRNNEGEVAKESPDRRQASIYCRSTFPDRPPSEEVRNVYVRPRQQLDGVMEFQTGSESINQRHNQLQQGVVGTSSASHLPLQNLSDDHDDDLFIIEPEEFQARSVHNSVSRSVDRHSIQRHVNIPQPILIQNSSRVQMSAPSSQHQRFRALLNFNTPVAMERCLRNGGRGEVDEHGRHSHAVQFERERTTYMQYNKSTIGGQFIRDNAVEKTHNVTQSTVSTRVHVERYKPVPVKVPRSNEHGQKRPLQYATPTLKEPQRKITRVSSASSSRNLMYDDQPNITKPMTRTSPRKSIENRSAQQFQAHPLTRESRVTKKIV